MPSRLEDCCVRHTCEAIWCRDTYPDACPSCERVPCPDCSAPTDVAALCECADPVCVRCHRASHVENRER